MHTRRHRLRSDIVILCALAALLLASCSSNGSPSSNKASGSFGSRTQGSSSYGNRANTSGSATQVATCEQYLSVPQAKDYTGATSFDVNAQTGPDWSWSDFPSRPTAQCIYNADESAKTGGIPILAKSPVLWLWLNQSEASQVYSALASDYPYHSHPYSPIAGIGQRASTNEGTVVVQVSSDDTFSIASGSNSPSTSMAMAKMIAQEISPEGSGGSPAVKATGGAGTQPSSVGNSGTTENASSGNAPTTTVPPTTNPPTTTTTISLQAAYQAGYQAGQATFKGDSPSEAQTYCQGALTYSPSISQSPALAAQFVSGCVAGEAS